jgi:hypothetical protein
MQSILSWGDSAIFDLAQEIQMRIEVAQKYISHRNNPALVKSYEIEIKTLRNAPRTERELLSAMRRVKIRMNLTVDVVDQEPLSAELEALEWLLPKVKQFWDQKT